jgi:hypothetical protein
MLGLVPLAVVVLAGGYHGEERAHPGPGALPAPAVGAPVPLHAGDVSGRIDDAETVTDLLAYNQAATVGFSIPVEGAIQRSKGIITRWELPIPVHVDPSISVHCVEDALLYWQSVTGLSFVLVGAGVEPRLTVRAAGSSELHVAAGLGLVYRTYPTNRAQLAVVKILARNANCSSPSVLFRHEFGHAIGIFGHPPGGLMSAPMVGTTASQREINMLVQLYHLPHGARIEHDGTWKVVQ